MSQARFNFQRLNLYQPGYSSKSRRRRYIWPKWYRIDRVQEGELLGSIQEQRVKCGKQNCKCATGIREDRHIAYYRFWRDNTGKLRKAYVKKSELEQVQEAIDRRKERLSRQRTKRNIHMQRGMGRGVAAHLRTYFTA